MDFLLVIIELFSLAVTVVALRANIDWDLAFFKRVGQFGPKFRVEGDVSHQPFFVSKNYRDSDLSYRTRMWAELSFVLSQFTRLTDGRTDGRLYDRQYRVAYTAAR